MSLTILGIETSCDETAAAVVRQGVVLSNTLFSQTQLHQEYGGVVPEVASRSHLEKICGIIETALNNSACSLDDIDVLAVTNRPGLPGSLLVGVCCAKAIAWSKQKKIIGIDHLEAHIFSAFLEHAVPFPHLCLTASGGHTSLYRVNDFGNFVAIGHTLDDAAGEAFDKIAKLIGLPYPGGPVIEQLAAQVNFGDFFHYPRSKISSLDFSFSGLKTAVLYDLVHRGAYDLEKKQFLKPNDQQLKQQISSSLLVCIADIFVHQLEHAVTRYPDTQAVTLVGGVACNKYIRTRLQQMCDANGLQFFTPASAYCTDNAAMIAYVGWHKALRNEYSDLNLDIF